MTKLKMCAYVYKLKENFDVRSVDFEHKTIMYYCEKEKLYKMISFDKVFLCYCDKHKTCKRRDK